ncbi:hypothetical protein AVEN_23345-1 [Araneus ventricosus]|uniref:Integrase p58-like C-terminal domain-containing protein n=1 Tax=Araneus ventricosus TaxID=182803 RepID=A0A4Y2FRY8_ARAVE|nr:hypothetical protein AVEN_23345-1 [Araneus ventricosus]
MYNPKLWRGLSPKLQQNWEGPYTIVKKLNDVVYRVKRSPNAKPKSIHTNRLAPYKESGDLRDKFGDHFGDLRANLETLATKDNEDMIHPEVHVGELYHNNNVDMNDFKKGYKTRIFWNSNLKKN